MTNDERRAAFDLRLSGMTWKEIGSALGYDGCTVRGDILTAIKGAVKQPLCRYPALRRYITAHCGGSVSAFAALCGVKRATLYPIFSGKGDPSKQVMDAILRVTGLPYEEAFREEAAHDPLSL